MNLFGGLYKFPYQFLKFSPTLLLNLSPIFAMSKNSTLSAQTPSTHPIGQPFIKLAQVDSTNNYAMGLAHEGLASHGLAVFAEHQSAGRGQRGKTWLTEPRQNITLSLILSPKQPYKPFLLSASTALACREFFESYAKSEVYVKWPNDIYWRDRKAGGILIENVLSGKEPKWHIVGMGININQVNFPEGIQKAVSLRQITGTHFDTENLARELCIFIDKRLNNQQENEIIQEYNDHLLFKGTVRKLRQNGKTFEALIKGVNHSGELIIEDTMERTIREVEWVI